MAFAALLLAPPPAIAEDIAPGLARLIATEQQLLSREVNTSRILTPKDNEQDPRYAPEAGNVFEIESYWLDANDVHQFDSGGFEPGLRAVLTRVHDGKPQVRLLVHPESKQLYAKLTARAQKAPSFMGTATSSSRTLLVWEQGKEASAFFAKLSLDAVIGGASRTVSSSQVVRSVGISKILASDGASLPESFGYFPEPWGIVPKGMDEAGMLVRAVPADIASGRTRLVPLFSLYAEPKDGAEPLLRGMIKRSGLAPDVFIKAKILRPFARQWAQLVFEHGITSEPHAQNVLMEIGEDGQPTGRFMHRDFGGFAADLDYRASLGMAEVADLPVLTTVAQDYRAERTRGDLGNLERYFAQGFVYNIDVALRRWGLDGGAGRRGLTRWFSQMVATIGNDNAALPQTAMKMLEAVTDEEFSSVLETPVEIPRFLHLAHHTGELRSVAISKRTVLQARRARRMQLAGQVVLPVDRPGTSSTLPRLDRRLTVDAAANQTVTPRKARARAARRGR
ncbi:MAG: hypothetical protein IPL79_18400 [Myxococcales bacterium]|nr:hypothetical protein [Myxococcales bacterium]